MKQTQVAALVTRLLKEDELTRKSDNYLFKRVHDAILPGASDMTLNEVLMLISTHKLPPFESVSRARRKAQERFPELVDKETAIYRGAKEEEYREWARA